jgi:hypothetical protein
MPFVSKAQMRRLWKEKPDVAKEYASHMTPEQIAKLPEHVKPKGKK